MTQKRQNSTMWSAPRICMGNRLINSMFLAPIPIENISAPGPHDIGTFWICLHLNDFFSDEQKIANGIPLCKADDVMCCNYFFIMF